MEIFFKCKGGRKEGQQGKKMKGGKEEYYSLRKTTALIDEHYMNVDVADRRLRWQPRRAYSVWLWAGTHFQRLMLLLLGTSVYSPHHSGSSAKIRHSVKRRSL